MIAYFLTFTSPGARLDEADRTAASDRLRRTPGLVQATLLTPATAHDPYLDDGPAPALMIECHFADIAALEAALARGGHLSPLASLGAMPSLSGATVTQQAMLARPFPVPDPIIRTAAGRRPCTYMVSYDGVAADLNGWLSHYLAHHPPIMAKFPGIRAIEVCTRIDWCSGLDLERADCIQRNSVMFDDAAALDAALNSPVRDEMRADFHHFPPFTGQVRHYPMATDTIVPEQEHAAP